MYIVFRLWYSVVDCSSARSAPVRVRVSVSVTARVRVSARVTARDMDRI